MAEQDTPPAGGGGGSIFTKKTGPLPNWVYMAVVLLAALIFSMWRSNKQAANAVEEGPSEEDVVPGDQTPPPVFILPQNPQPTVPVNVTVNNPGTPSTAPPTGQKPPATTTPPKPGTPKPSVPGYYKVTIKKFTSNNPVWDSTLWGIAKNYGYGSGGSNWTSIWNDPRNKALKTKRKDPKKIQPGDIVYVKMK